MGVLGRIADLVGAIAKNANFNGELDNLLKTHGQLSAQLGSTIGRLDAMAAMSGKGVGAAETEKLLYIAALQGAIAKASATPLFNVETQINDLWMRLDQLRAAKARIGTLSDAIAKNQNLTREMQQIAQRQSQLAQTIAQQLQ